MSCCFYRNNRKRRLVQTPLITSKATISPSYSGKRGCNFPRPSLTHRSNQIQALPPSREFNIGFPGPCLLLKAQAHPSVTINPNRPNSTTPRRHHQNTISFIQFCLYSFCQFYVHAKQHTNTSILPNP